jgi:hypothetical protein
MPDTQTSPLFLDSIEEALKEAVRLMGGAKKVGGLMRPEMLADDAGRWLSNCFNDEKRDKLSLKQMAWILREAKKAGIHTAINYICNDAGYSNPAPIEPEDEKTRIQREFIESVRQQTSNLKRMEEMFAMGSPTLRAA